MKAVTYCIRAGVPTINGHIYSAALVEQLAEQTRHQAQQKRCFLYCSSGGERRRPSLRDVVGFIEGCRVVDGCFEVEFCFDARFPLASLMQTMFEAGRLALCPEIDGAVGPDGVIKEDAIVVAWACAKVDPPAEPAEP